MPDLQVDAVGIKFTTTLMEKGLVVDISTATQKNIIITKPHRIKLNRTASFVTDGTDGKISYDTVSGEIDVTGTYRIQAFIKTPAGDYFTEIKSFFVAKNL